MNERIYKVGFVGFGMVGKVHAYGYLNLPFFSKPIPLRTRISHVCTSRPESAEEGRALVGADHAVTDFREITENPEVDIVHICTPNSLHKEALLSAMRHQKHIYCDKPIVATMAEAEEVRAALPAYRGTAQMTLQNRFFPAALRARQLMEEGFVGQVLEFRACFLHAGSVDPNLPWRWRFSAAHGGGVIADLGSHLLDFVHYLLGEFGSVSAMTKIAWPERPLADASKGKMRVDVEDCVLMLARMKSGAFGTIEATKLATGAEDEMRMEIHGTRGALRYNSMDTHHLEAFDMLDSDKPIGGMRGWTRIDTGRRYPEPGASFPGPKFCLGWLRSHAACLANFLGCVAEGKPASPSLEQGIYLQHLMDCAHRSAREQRWVEAGREG